MKAISILIVCAVLVSACATPGQQTKTEGTAIGTGLGAALGAGIGYALGGAQGAAIGAGAGALFGGAGGYLYANNIDKYNQELIGK